MTSRKPKIYDPERKPEPKYFTRVPDDALEDPRLGLVTQAVFAQLLKRNWTNDQALKVTQAEIASRCRLSERALLPHLVKLEQCGYIARERDRDKWGAPYQITLTSELRPALEMAADVPIAKGSKCTHRKKTSGEVRKKTSGVHLPKTSDPLFREMGEREMGEISSPPAPSAGPLPAAPLIDSGPPDYPDPWTSMFMVMPGEHKHPEIEARELWGDIWRAWKSPKLCYGFYEHQEWCTFKGWKHAIKTVIKRGTVPNSIQYLEKIAMDADLNGIKEDKPVQRGSIGPVPYVPTSRQQKPAAPRPSESDPDPEYDDPIAAELFSRLCRAKGPKAIADAQADLERYAAEKKSGCGSSLERSPQPAGVHHPSPAPTTVNIP